jgi:hypothetical protein
MTTVRSRALRSAAICSCNAICLTRSLSSGTAVAASGTTPAIGTSMDVLVAAATPALMRPITERMLSSAWCVLSCCICADSPCWDESDIVPCCI